MAQFKVAHDYRSNHNGRYYAYDKGATVDVDEETAEWVNRDSPGTLAPVKTAAKKTAAKKTEPKDAGDGGDD